MARYPNSLKRVAQVHNISPVII